MSVRFEDYSIQVEEMLDEKALQFLIEAANEVKSSARRDTPTGKAQLKGSWEAEVDEDKMSATIGSPLQESIWNEYGTGSHAEAKHGGTGIGRRGWWVYIQNQPTSSGQSKVYETKEDAERAVAFLRSKGLAAVATNGTEAKFTLFNSFDSNKNKLIARAEDIFRGV